MKLIRLSLFALALAAAACAPVKDHNNARRMQKEHSRSVDAINYDNTVLIGLYNINLSPVYIELNRDADIKDKAWIIYSADQRNDARARIQSLISRAGS